MRLERLEINGFKSFSDRSELAFDKGVTAIVGPNGCGKSNVADAITWVMGEQSAKSLRGERMEDVIFNGSDARKPTAAAEVRLRLTGVLQTLSGPAFPTDRAPGVHAEADNGNGNGHSPLHEPANGNGNGHGNGNGNGNGHGLAHGGNGHAAVDDSHRLAEQIIQSVAREIEVTRRLYRSGESEYLIDGQICRLRDVHDLLMDTGLGAKAYAIIEQGKIGMILSSRPTDRRQLIEEAAGVTKYKARRRAAELKLEAARQNLTRVDDIVFEVEKQRGTLKRQAAKARRYQKLRDELRRWEKVLFARKYRQLAEIIESARGRLADARDQESLALGRVSQDEMDFGRLRIEAAEAEARATSARETAHARELAINRDQQQIGFDREQALSLGARIAAIEAELAATGARRGPTEAALDARRAALLEAQAERQRASAALAQASAAYESGHRDIEELESDVEAARSDVFSSINSATALRHALEHAGSARDRVAELLSKLSVESDDVRLQAERAAADHAAATETLRRTQDAIEATKIARQARESELASARIEHDWRSRSVRAQEQGLAAMDARLTSLVELEAARAAYGDAPRAVLAEADGRVHPKGAVADYLEVDAGYERAVEAFLGELLQHVVVEQAEHAAAGFELVREAAAGRCGFLIASQGASFDAEPGATVESGPADVVTLSAVVRVAGPYAGAIRRASGEAWIADSYARAQEIAGGTTVPVLTRDGMLFRGPHLVAGGGPDDGRGILETKRSIKELRERIETERNALVRLSEETAALEATIATASHAIGALNAEQHKQEKAMVAVDAQLQHVEEESTRLRQKGDQLVRERLQAEEECEALDRRQDEARESIVRLQNEQQKADERLMLAQRRLIEARESSEDLSRTAAEAGAAHAAMQERAAALDAEVARLEESTAELTSRQRSLETELDGSRRRVDELRAAIAAGEEQLDADVSALDALRLEVQQADDAVLGLRLRADEHEASLKTTRASLETVRAVVAELDVARATAESDLSHLAASCADTVQASLDEVRDEVDELERSGGLASSASIDVGEEADEAEDLAGSPVGMAESIAALHDPGPAVQRAEQRAVGAEDAITALRAKIDRLGPVNMMAIEQFDELEARHAFLAAERKDLVDAIAQTSEAIRRIDETTRRRFNDAFSAINTNFQETFSTLFGGGRAGLTLLDDTDPLESGIEIIAQPPGKRLQSVQLLSGGEKALTAIALMFAMFKYKPSPFCLLDEIDAPLDDANIGRFVEMLRGMQQHTQFIVITHNRKTMEIADRLYGVTMEEPGVSKLISVQLN